MGRRSRVERLSGKDMPFEVNKVMTKCTFLKALAIRLGDFDVESIIDYRTLGLGHTCTTPLPGLVLRQRNYHGSAALCGLGLACHGHPPVCS